MFDTLTGLIPLPITNYNYFYYLYVNKTVVDQSYFISGGEVGCALYGWSALTFKSGAMLILTIIPFERLLAINFPFWYKKSVKLWKISLVLVAAIIFSAFHSLLPAIPGISVMKPYGTQKSYCHFEYDEPNNIGSVIYTYFIQIYGYGMVLTASFCYTLLICSIIQFLIRRRQYTTNNSSNNSEWGVTKKKEFLLSLKFMLILVLFNIGWLPFLVSLTFRTVLPRCSAHEDVQSILEFLGVRIAVLNSVINPIVYVLLMQSYRQGYKVLFGTCCHWITCRKFALFKPNKNNKEEYLSKALYQKSKEVSHTYSFYSEYRTRQRSLNNSRENVSIFRQDSLLASPRYVETGYNSGKNSVTSIPQTDVSL
ncbi:Beta-2 adrenergic receptor-like [Oopsacas minuta]|uniref:Beta-2 adrenergic receptor-like n=1 Tax=Oopsacas minuta TaxID=111878 RepID=A0AAV7JZM0_9METZ|nr:Beta-2 adrenergic receptor-like [Oopsacas minuta]